MVPLPNWSLYAVVVQDTVIYDRLEGDQPFKDVTIQHLTDFANLGIKRLHVEKIFIF